MADVRPGSARPNKRVLVVDDNRDSAASLALLLQALGHEVAVSNDGFTALNACRTHRPDVVLLDIYLPDLDGYQVARRLREEHRSGVTIVAVTGISGDDVRQKCLEAGFDHHLLKPIEPGYLKSLLG